MAMTVEERETLVHFTASARSAISDPPCPLRPPRIPKNRPWRTLSLPRPASSCPAFSSFRMAIIDQFSRPTPVGRPENAVVVVAGAHLRWIRWDRQSFRCAMACFKHPLGVPSTNPIARFRTGQHPTTHKPEQVVPLAFTFPTAAIRPLQRTQ